MPMLLAHSGSPMNLVALGPGSAVYTLSLPPSWIPYFFQYSSIIMWSAAFEMRYSIGPGCLEEEMGCFVAEALVRTWAQWFRDLERDMGWDGLGIPVTRQMIFSAIVTTV
ncbi:hypothetical protein BJ170DRAFT_681428 [Xylariales sp. AK1849]|nr:hypothetical protein BJ170DRAFT_681428 [Xylariales sp. AK1849]